VGIFQKFIFLPQFDIVSRGINSGFENLMFDYGMGGIKKGLQADAHSPRYLAKS